MNTPKEKAARAALRTAGDAADAACDACDANPSDDNATAYATARIALAAAYDADNAAYHVARNSREAAALALGVIEE